jgi:hypothetical protein
MSFPLSSNNVIRVNAVSNPVQPGAKPDAHVRSGNNPLLAVAKPDAPVLPDSNPVQPGAKPDAHVRPGNNPFLAVAKPDASVGLVSKTVSSITISKSDAAVRPANPVQPGAKPDAHVRSGNNPLLAVTKPGAAPLRPVSNPAPQFRFAPVTTSSQTSSVTNQEARDLVPMTDAMSIASSSFHSVSTTLNVSTSSKRSSSSRKRNIAASKRQKKQSQVEGEPIRVLMAAVELNKEMGALAVAGKHHELVDIFSRVPDDVFDKTKHHVCLLLKWMSEDCLAHNELAEEFNKTIPRNDPAKMPIMPTISVGRKFATRFIATTLANGRNLMPPDLSEMLLMQAKGKVWWSEFHNDSMNMLTTYVPYYNDFFHFNLPRHISLMDVLARKGFDFLPAFYRLYKRCPAKSQKLHCVFEPGLL